MRRTVSLCAAMLALAAPAPLAAQGPSGVPDRIDSIVVTGNVRVPTARVLTMIGIRTPGPAGYREVQRALTTLYASGQFADARVSVGVVNGQRLLRFDLVERPLLAGWRVEGVEELSPRSVRGRVRLREGSPFDPADVQRAVGAIDSLYRREGFYLASVTVEEEPAGDGMIQLRFAIDEGSRVAISQVAIEGNTALSDDDVVGAMSTGPEGFFWFQKGQYSEREVERDVRERIPAFYAERGYIDVRVVHDTLLVAEGTGKATLVVTVEEGAQYHVGRFEVIGNRRFSTDQLDGYYPFAAGRSGFLGLSGAATGPAVFDEAEWQEATQRIRTLYANNGYLYAQIQPLNTRRRGANGEFLVDLRWQIQEGSPATIRRIDITGNTITHEDVVRRATFPLVPGDIFRQDALIQAYQNITNLGFFQQPLVFPDVRPANQQGDVDLVFRVEERRTGNINFGASVGQGTGLGGFIGLDEPNLMGRGKRIGLQWQFGRNISDFNITYSDPALRGGLISGSINLHSTRLRYTIADLGRITTRGGSVQLGFPLFGTRYTRLFTS